MTCSNCGCKIPPSGTGEKLLLALSKSKETTLLAAPVEEASEPWLRLTITGPERLTGGLLDYIFALRGTE